MSVHVLLGREWVMVDRVQVRRWDRGVAVLIVVVGVGLSWVIVDRKV